jgi:hypothetical protein
VDREEERRRQRREVLYHGFEEAVLRHYAILDAVDAYSSSAPLDGRDTDRLFGATLAEYLSVSAGLGLLVDALVEPPPLLARAVEAEGFEAREIEDIRRYAEDPELLHTLLDGHLNFARQTTLYQLEILREANPRYVHEALADINGVKDYSQTEDVARSTKGLWSVLQQEPPPPADLPLTTPAALFLLAEGTISWEDAKQGYQARNNPTWREPPRRRPPRPLVQRT